MDSAFEGCTNLRYNAADNPDLSRVTSMAEMFKGATAFNGNIGNIGNIGDWDISQVSDMSDMFDGVTLSTENYDALLEGWSTIEGEESIVLGVTFGAGNSQYCAAIAKTILESTYNWNITDSGFADNCPRDPAAFITTWITSGANENISIPTHNQSTYNYSVNWGDGNADINQTGNTTHTYATAGAYTVTIIGDFPRIYFNNSGDRNKITSIEQWGTNTWSSMDSAFEGCTNLLYNAADNPDLSQVASLVEMFKGRHYI